MVSFTCGDPVAAHPRLGGEDAWASHEGCGRNSCLDADTPSMKDPSSEAARAQDEGTERVLSPCGREGGPFQGRSKQAELG